MPRHHRETYNVDVPAKPDLASIEPVCESLADLAARRDALRLMAERASDEANRLDRELTSLFASHERELRSLAARLTNGAGR
jgi:hypothetical protein